MKKDQIKVGGLYLAKVSGVITTVRVDAIRMRGGYDQIKDQTVYDVTNTRTGRKITFHSAAKFRGEARQPISEASIAHDQALADFQRRVQESLEDASRLAEDEESSDPIPPYVPTVDSQLSQSSESNTTVKSAQQVDVQPTAIVDQEVAEQQRPFAGSNRAVTTPVVPIATEGVSTHQNSLAARIAQAKACQLQWSPGMSVAGMTPNEEQESILELASKQDMLMSAGGCLVIGAGAGTGKTATLKMLEEILQGVGQYTAFNRSLVDESRVKFKKASCKTTHQLAFHAVGKKYQHRLNSKRMRTSQIARILGIETMTVTLEGDVDPQTKLPRTKRLSAELLTGRVLVAIRRFCQSADREITVKHIPYIDGIDSVIEMQNEDGETYKKRSTTNNDKVKEYLLPKCLLAWKDLTELEGQLQFAHDHYVKIWSLGEGQDRPIIAADYILLDEAQDTAPVFLDIIKRQTHALVILVGDQNQSIYEWRGAVDAMKFYPNAPRRMLSQSYRFGQTIADVANTILATLEEPTDLVMKGLPSIPSRVTKVKNPKACLYRTNAGAISKMMSEYEEGRKPHLIGGGDDVIAWCNAAIELKARRPTDHSELCCFDSWKEVQEYSKTDEGADMRLMVKLIDTFGAEDIKKALQDMPDEKEADVVLCTAHKSKGREWETVYLGQDFPTVNKMSDSDRRLLYVAATRAKLTLDISECPPFCGGKDGFGEDERFIPGLEIQYTCEMPTQEQQEARIKDKTGFTVKAEIVTTPPSVGKDGTTGYATLTEIKERCADKFTWTKWSGVWAVRGPHGAKIGDEVEVERKDGSRTNVTIRAISWENDDSTIYSI